MASIGSSIGGLVSAVGSLAKTGVLIAIAGVVLLTIVVWNARRNKKQMKKLESNIDERVRQHQEILDEDSEVVQTRIAADVRELSGRVCQLADNLMESLREDTLYMVEDKLAPKLRDRLVNDAPKTRDVGMDKLTFAPFEIISSNVESSADADGTWDIASFVVSSKCNMTMHTLTSGICIDNYSTPSEIKLRMIFTRNRRAVVPSQATICPVCGTPVFGSACIVCGEEISVRSREFKLEDFFTTR